MANRLYNQFQYSLDKNVVSTFGSFTATASTGAVASGSVKGLGVSSVTKESTAGQYTIAFADKFSRFLVGNFMTITAAASNVGGIQVLATLASYQSDIATNKAITIQLVDFAGSAVNVSADTIIRFEIKWRNSSVSTSQNA